MRRIALAVAMSAALLPAAASAAHQQGERAAPAATAPVAASERPRPFVVSTYFPRSGFFSPRYVTIISGMGMTFAQADPLALHDVISTDTHPKTGEPLFTNGRLLGVGGVEPVIGVEALPPGTYPFTCSLHYDMYGEIEVIPALS